MIVWKRGGSIGKIAKSVIGMMGVKSHNFVVVCFWVPYRAKLCRAKVTNFFKSDENFARQIISPDENFARQSFAQQDNQSLSKWLVSLVDSLVLHLKTVLLLLGETFRRAKVTNFSFGDENFARRIVSPDENFARQSFAR